MKVKTGESKTIAKSVICAECSIIVGFRYYKTRLHAEPEPIFCSRDCMDIHLECEAQRQLLIIRKHLI